MAPGTATGALGRSAQQGAGGSIVIDPSAPDPRAKRASRSLDTSKETTAGRIDQRRWLRTLKEAHDLVPESGIGRWCQEDAARGLRAAYLCSRDAITLRPKQGTKICEFALLQCGKHYCPDCSHAWSFALLDRLLPVVSAVYAPRLRHMVLTIPNAPDGQLAEGITALLASWRSWIDVGRDRTTCWFAGVTGYIRKLEITRNEESQSWHPHLHVLLDVGESFDFTGASAARGAWSSVTAGHEFDASPAAQWITACKDSRDAAREVGKYVGKAVDVQPRDPHQLLELAGAIRGRRFIASHGTLRVPGAFQAKRYEVVGKVSKLVHEYETTGDPIALQYIRTFAELYSDHPTAREAIPDWVFSL